MADLYIVYHKDCPNLPKINMASQSANSKNVAPCAQCETSMKKNTKSMNCSICKHWFCLDCSHISNKLYDVLRSEPSTRNLPFNCDGCTRLLPKLTELGSALNTQQQKLVECEKKVDSLRDSLQSAVEKQVEKAITEYKEREERKCNLIVHNVPEPKQDSLDKKRDNEGSLHKIFETTHSGEVKIVDFTRLGKPTAGKNRLIKIQLGSVSDKHKVLGGTKHLRTKIGEEYAHEWSSVFITPDQTKEEPNKSINLKRELERRKKEEKNANLVIFRGEIIERKSYASAARGSVVPTPDLEPGRPFHL